METEGTIRAYQKILSSWVFEKPVDFPEKFAQERFLKKMEVPSVENDRTLAENAWINFIQTDNSLPDVHLPSAEWYKARILLHSWIRGDRTRSPIDFPKGSSVIPTRGFNSIEFRLAGGAWTCTPENFNEFCRLVYNHKALKRAFRRRYTTWFLKSRFSQDFKESERILWNRFCHRDNAGWLIFKWKLAQITTFVRGSRFSTVPKNNLVRRPINIEPFGNLLVQRQLGNFLRSRLKDQGIDLDNLAYVHQKRCANDVATIDLKNASDSMSLSLMKFLLPKSIMAVIDRSRSFLLYGGDHEYHTLKKVSSMGNGFTFELMTMVLNAICRTLDDEASVFGDDIIIKKDCAPRLIELLKEVGFTVNLEKSFLEGPFRESCGANYHDEFGYIDSFDFKYPKDIADCALILTKCFALRKYSSFSKLYHQLLKRTPKALLGGPIQLACGLSSWAQPDLNVSFACDLWNLQEDNSKKARLLKRALCISKVHSAVEFVWKPDLRTKTVIDMNSRYHWAKYEMYLNSGRVAKDVISGQGRWVERKVFVVNGYLYRIPKRTIRKRKGKSQKT